MHTKHFSISRFLVATALLAACHATKQQRIHMPAETKAEIISFLDTKALSVLANVDKAFRQTVKWQVSQRHRNDQNAYEIKIDSDIDFSEKGKFEAEKTGYLFVA